MGTIDGYGGVFNQSCRLAGNDVAVLYGHVDPNRFRHVKGQEIKKGDGIAFLAQAERAENGFTRKHLHLGIGKGLEVEIPGYLKNQNLLESFIDPLPLLEEIK